MCGNFSFLAWASAKMSVKNAVKRTYDLLRLRSYCHFLQWFSTIIFSLRNVIRDTSEENEWNFLRSEEDFGYFDSRTFDTKINDVFGSFAFRFRLCCVSCVLIPSVSAFLSPCSLCVHDSLSSPKQTNYNTFHLDIHVMDDTVAQLYGFWDIRILMNAIRFN